MIVKLNKVFLYLALLYALSQCAAPVQTETAMQTTNNIPQYENILAGNVLEAGLGFTDIITVYDTPKEMYELLGTPREDMDSPFTYFYDTGAFSITFVCEFNRKDMNFRIDQIHVDADPQKLIPTAKGITLGDSRRDVIKAYGEHFDIFTDGIAYLNDGIGFLLDENDNLIKIIVYRIRRQELPKWLEISEYDGEMTSHEFMQMKMDIPSDWIPTTIGSECIVDYEAPDGSTLLLVSHATEDDNFTFEGFVQLEQALFVEENFIPEKDRWLEPDILKMFNANQGYISQSVMNKGEKRSYMLILEKERYPDGEFQNNYYTISLDVTLDTLNISIEPDEVEVNLVSTVFRSTYLNGPLIPGLKGAESLDPEVEKILPSLGAIIDACVFRKIDVLCKNLLDFDKAYDEDILQPLDYNNEDHKERAYRNMKRINNYFQAQDYTASYLGTDIDEFTWYGIEVTNASGEKATFGFVKYKQGYLLGDID